MKMIFKQIYWKLKYFFRQLIIRIIYLLPINNQKVFLSSFAGLSFSDNPKFIALSLLKYDKVKIIWGTLNLNESLPTFIKKTKLYTLNFFYHYATSKVIISNVRSFHPLKKRKKQVYMQTSHGRYSFKKIEKECCNKLASSYLKTAIYDGSICDAIIVASSFIEKIYRNSFWLNDKCEYLKIGQPRDDILYNPNKKIIIDTKVKLGINDNDFVILYAPTFRNNCSMKAYLTPYFNDIIKTFFARVNKKVKLIYKLHPNILQTPNINFERNIILFNNYSNISFQELALISDVCISDYSGSIFDFVILKKEIYLYTPDEKAYCEERGLNELYYQHLFSNAHNIETLIKNIKNKKGLLYDAKRFLDYSDGNSSDKAAKWIVSHLKIYKNYEKNN